MVYIWTKNTSVLHGKYWKENLYICVIKDTGSVRVLYQIGYSVSSAYP